MKGPGLRIDLDVRRLWRCSKCGRTVRTPGHITAQRCGCSEESPWMVLVPAAKREPFRPPPREPLPDPDTAAEGPAVAAAVLVADVIVDTPVVEQPVPAPPEESELAAGSEAVEAAVTPDATTDPGMAAPSIPAAEPSEPEEFGAGLGGAAPDSPA